MNDESKDAATDLDEVDTTWLHLCGSCDAGITTSCTCPVGDPRSVIAALSDEVRLLRAKLREVEACSLVLAAGVVASYRREQAER